MKQLLVPFEENSPSSETIAAIAIRLNKAEKHPLTFTPWAAFPYKPAVSFSLVYTATHILLQYQVTEDHLQAAHGQTNSPVYQDSCVEFFISFDNGASYYNFEFNCIGTVLAAYGKNRTERSFLPEEAVSQIGRQAVVQRRPGEQTVSWELTVALPLTVFVFHSLNPLKGKACRANFYKCGDGLPVPHFLAWSTIENDRPDFHLPRYFGTLLFQ